MPDDQSRAPLAGVRVLDLSRFFAGGYCTLALVDLGAEVVKVETPGSGDPLRGLPAAHVGLNRGKRSITLDTRHRRAPEVLTRLVAHFDVVVENNSPGVMDAMGFGYDVAAAANPRVIWCSVTGFGQDSPYAKRPGHDITYLGHAGLLVALHEIPWHPQTTIAVPVGALMGALGVAAALAQRAHTGKGCRIDASLTDAATWLLAGDFVSLTGRPRGGLGSTASRQIYRCSDGKSITIAAQEPRFWKTFCERTGLTDLIDKLQAPPEEQLAMMERLAALFATRPAAEWVAELGDVNAAVGPVNDASDLPSDPHVVARSMMPEIDGIHVPGNPLRLSDAEGLRSPLSFAPPSALGADTDAVYSDIGFSASELAELREEKVI